MPDRFTKGSDGYIRHKGFRCGTLYSNVRLDGDVTMAPLFDIFSRKQRISFLNDFILLLTRERDLLVEEGENK